MRFRPRLKIYKSSTGNNTFNPETFEARSYNHWLYVMKHKGHIIFNDYNYSVTTNKHQGETRRLMRNELNLNMDKVIYVNQRESLSSGIMFKPFLDAIALATIRLNSKGKSGDYKASQKMIIETNTMQIKQLKKLGFKPETTLKECLERQQKNETYRLERARLKSQAARAKKQALLTQYKDVMKSTDAVTI